MSKPEKYFTIKPSDYEKTHDIVRKPRGYGRAMYRIDQLHLKYLNAYAVAYLQIDRPDAYIPNRDEIISDRRELFRIIRITGWTPSHSFLIPLLTEWIQGR